MTLIVTCHLIVLFLHSVILLEGNNCELFWVCVCVYLYEEGVMAISHNIFHVVKHKGDA